MDVRNLIQKISKITDDIKLLEKSVVYAFLQNASLDIEKSEYFVQYFSGFSDGHRGKILNLIKSISVEDQLDIYWLVEVFELLIPKDQRKGKGIVYTPTSIKDYIIGSTIVSANIPYICDPSCGCGSFLISAAEFIHHKYHISYSEVFKKYIFGIDIDIHAIEKAETLFNVLAFLHDETIDNHNLICGDALDLSVLKSLYKLVPNGFDYVIGNPPYVRSRNMSDDSKKHLKNWETAKSGNVDLYIPFFEVGIYLLKTNGRLGYISPNTFLQSVNGRSLRQHFLNAEYDISILDFRETQVFNNVTSYTCIVLIDKNNVSAKIHYALLNGKSSLFDYEFTEYNINDFPNGTPWRMCKEKTDIALRRMEHTGIQLENYKIRNGLATLKNDIYFFVPTDTDEHFYYRTYNDASYKIEKGICIDVIKPNTLKCEADLDLKMEKAIFPYKATETNYNIIEECELKENYPYAYAFFLDVKEILMRRDKGKGNYASWFAYGRSQGITNWGKKLLIPYIAGTPTAVISTRPDVLFYCGYAVFSENENELVILKRYLESSAFWFYIKNTSKPYAKGYMAFAKNYIKKFSIPTLSQSQKEYLLNEKDPAKIDWWIWESYGLCKDEWIRP